MISLVDEVEVTPRDSTFSCLICFEEQPAAERRSFSCGHALCAACAAAYVSSKIEEGAVSGDRLPCPSVSPAACTTTLFPADVRACIGPGKAGRAAWRR